MKPSAALSPLDRAIGTIAEDARAMRSEGMMRKDGAEWEPDLQLSYVREA